MYRKYAVQCEQVHVITETELIEIIRLGLLLALTPFERVADLDDATELFDYITLRWALTFFLKSIFVRNFAILFFADVGRERFWFSE